jgi:hypothetical protein
MILLAESGLQKQVTPLGGGAGAIGVNPFVDWVLCTIFNPTEHNGETQAKKFYPLVGG